MNFPCIVLNKKETQKIQTRSCGIRDYCEGLFFLQNVISVVFSNWDFLMKWKLKFFLVNSEFKVLTRAVEMHDNASEGKNLLNCFPEGEDLLQVLTELSQKYHVKILLNF